MIKLTLAALAACLALAAAPAAAKLTPAETRMMRTIDAEQARTLALLETMVNQNSGSFNLAGVEAVGRMARAELEPLGFAVEWIDMKAVGRAGHIVARHRGKGRGKRMLLIAHLDTVFELDSPFQKWTRSGDIGVGPGATDDKGGMAVMFAALRAMKAAGTLARADIEIVLTGDEEETGSPLDISRAHLVAAGKRADVALDFEAMGGENGRDIGRISRRGNISWELRTTGRTVHSSGIFTARVGDGAIYELARVITAFRAELPEPSLTFNVGLVAGGVTAELDADKIRAAATGKTNITPAAAIALGDLRTLSSDQLARVQAKMRAIVARHLPQTQATLTFETAGYPPMAPTEGNRALLARLNAVNRDLGLPEMGELHQSKGGAGDIGHVANDVDGLVGLGAGGAGGGGHAVGEGVNIPSIWRQAKRAAILMSRLSVEKR